MKNTSLHNVAQRLVSAVSALMPTLVLCSQAITYSKAHRPHAKAPNDKGTRTSQCRGRGPLCAFLKSAQGPATRRHTTKELACPWGGALDPGPVVRVFLRSAKGADARHQSTKELACPSGGALDTAAVLRLFLKRVIYAN